MKPFLQFLLKCDEGGMILGGRFQPIIDIFEYFCGEIKKKGANLVFFWRLIEGKLYYIDEFMTNNEAYDCIKNHQSIKEYLSNEKLSYDKPRPHDRIWYNLIRISQKYGEIYLNYASEGGPILAYARQNKTNVLSLITRETDYLIYNDEFEFWSLSNFQLFEFKIVKFDRHILNEVFGLNSLQMRLLYAMSLFEPEDMECIFRDNNSLQGYIAYVKQQIHLDHNLSWNSILRLTGDLTAAHKKKISKRLNRLHRINSYCTSSDDDFYYLQITKHLSRTTSNFNSMMKFYKNNIYFAYKLMDEWTTIQKDLLYIDSRESNAKEFVELIAYITLKLSGILFKDTYLKRPVNFNKPISKSRMVATLSNDNFKNTKDTRTQRDIIYPPRMCEKCLSIQMKN